MKKPTPKGSLWWVGRGYGNLGSRYYYLHYGTRPPHVTASGVWYAHRVKEFSLEEWHAVSELRLRPGEGPVRIRIKPGSWERV